MESKRIGLPEVAMRLGVHRATVNDMVLDERLPAERVGAQWTVSEADLEAFAATYTRPRNAPRRSTPVENRLRWTARFVELLIDWGHGTAAELSEAVELHQGNVRKHLCLAEKAGLVSRDEFGNWSATDDGTAFLRAAGLVERLATADDSAGQRKTA